MAPVAADIEPGPLTALHHLDSVDTELVVDHLHHLGSLDGDGAGGDAVEVVISDDQLVRVDDLQSRQRNMIEPVSSQNQLFHSVS